MRDLGGKPRLLVLASTYPRWARDVEPGFVHELSRRLVKEFDVWVLAPHAPGAARVELLDGVRVHRYRYAPECLETLVSNGGIAVNLRLAKWKALLIPGFVLMQSLALWRLHRRHRYGVVHAHWLIPQGLIAAWFRSLGGPPFVVTSHGADVFALRGRIFARLRGFVAGKAAAVGVVSDALSQRLKREGVSPAHLRNLPMGVDLAERFVSSTQRADQGHLLFVGRLVEKKGVRQLIKAMPLILCHKPKAHLSIVGAGPEALYLRNLVRSLDLGQCVRFIGAVDNIELPHWYHSAAVVVAPFVEAISGDQEGLGLVVIEALACGRPVVVGEVEAASELPRMVPGLHLTNASDPGDLAASILAVLDDSTIDSPHKIVARTQAARRWDWQTVSRDYARVLGDACPSGHIQ